MAREIKPNKIKSGGNNISDSDFLESVGLIHTTKSTYKVRVVFILYTFV